MKKTMIFTVVGVLALAGLFAQESGSVRDVSGKVEIRAAGGAWEPAVKGAKVDLGTQISTGFNSRATVVIANSEIQVQPLSRLTLSELIKRRDELQTQLDLRVGKIRVEVKKDPSLKNDFTVRSPVSTAAIRGTIFTFDGQRLDVKDGRVRLANRTGLGRIYSAGQQGFVPVAGRPLTPEVQVSEKATVTPIQTPADAPGISTQSPPSAQTTSTTATLVITW